MGAETVPDHEIRYHLVAFDADGRERPEDGRPYSREVLRETAATTPTDVFVFSHGWMGDIPAARGQYGRWLAAMASCAVDRAAAHARPEGFRALLIGLHWPSQGWGDEELGTASFDVVADGSPGRRIVDGYAARLVDSPATREALDTIVHAALRDVAPVTLPPEVRQAYEVLDAEAGMGAAGAGAAPGDDRDRFDAESTYQACQVEELVSFGGPVLAGVLAPLRVLTFWHMKRPAPPFGGHGAARPAAGPAGGGTA